MNRDRLTKRISNLLHDYDESHTWDQCDEIAQAILYLIEGEGAVTSATDPSAEPQDESDLTDGSYLFRSVWGDDPVEDGPMPRSAWIADPPVRMPDRGIVQAIKTIGGPFEVRVVTETTIEKVEP